VALTPKVKPIDAHCTVAGNRLFEIEKNPPLNQDDLQRAGFWCKAWDPKLKAQ